jgi:hypothetical protein
MRDRWTLRLAVLLVSLVAAAPPASAFRVHGEVISIPIIGRFPGAEGTQWRTDLFVANHYSPEQTVALRFHVSGGAMIERTVTLHPFSSISLPDVVLNTFGLSNAGGSLELVSIGGGTIEARARIYNAGNPAGQFGQGAPGLAVDRLSRQSFLYGLSGVGGNRLNVGVTNPNGTAVDVTLRVSDSANVLLHSRSFTLQPHQNVQFNDIFSTFGIPPQSGIQVEMNSVELPIHGYAAEVRDDTGDAVFVVGTSPNA